MLRYDDKDKKVTEHRELAKTNLRIVAWGQDADGEVYAVDFVNGGIFHLVAAPPAPEDAPIFPRKLSETGLFSDTDQAHAREGTDPVLGQRRTVVGRRHEGALHGHSRRREDRVRDGHLSAAGARLRPRLALPRRHRDGEDVFPGNGTGELAAGWRRDCCVCKIMGGTEEYGDQVWNGYTYIWNDDQTDAELADSKGVDREFTLKNAKAPGETRKQTWHFPSRAECTMCHTVTGKYTLGVNTVQMNQDHNYGGVVANQLATLEHLGLFDRKLPAPAEKLARLADYRDPKADLDARRRAYLHANCSHCHRKWGGGNAEFQLISTLPLKDLGVVNTKPGQGTFDLKDPRILVPGEPERSLIHYRMTRLGLGRMPHIASTVVDEDAVKLIGEWIKAMK